VLAGEGAEIEKAVMAPYEKLVNGLEKAGLEAARRPLRLVPRAMEWALEDACLVLEFELPSGGYATSVLQELVTTPMATISESE
jgi:tRNA pseudouridine13 synthase